LPLAASRFLLRLGLPAEALIPYLQKPNLGVP
jgi:hypothetical protein